MRLRGLQLRFVGRLSTRLPFFCAMHLLYLDDAGSANNATEEYLVLGGVSVYESQAQWITQELGSLAESIQPGDPYSVEFHASEIFSRRADPWRDVQRRGSRCH